MNLETLDPPALNPASRLDVSQCQSLATVLGRAYHANPSLIYAIPDPEARRIVSPWLFSAVIRAGQLYGEIRTTKSGDGASVWISPANGLSVRRIMDVALTVLPFRLESGIARRCMKLAAYVEEVRKQLAPSPHWFLMAIDAETWHPEKAIGEALIEPVLLRADSTWTPCYLETFDGEKLEFYRSYGFQIVGAGRVPGGGPDFWALTRAL